MSYAFSLWTNRFVVSVAQTVVRLAFQECHDDLPGTTHTRLAMSVDDARALRDLLNRMLPDDLPKPN